MAPVPAGLINGSTYGGGNRPPFRPERIIKAVRQVIGRSQVSDAELIEIAAPPDFLIGCAVTGDFAAPVDGYPTVLRLQVPPGAKIRLGDWLWLVETGPRGVLVEHLPPNASRPEVKEISEDWLAANG